MADPTRAQETFQAMTRHCAAMQRQRAGAKQTRDGSGIADPFDFQLTASEILSPAQNQIHDLAKRQSAAHFWGDDLTHPKAQFAPVAFSSRQVEHPAEMIVARRVIHAA